ncbi:MAG: hypothetical protein WCH61_11290 [bacterium]
MKSHAKLHAKTPRLAMLLTAVALFSLGQASRAATLVADYARDVKAPAASAAAGWTYWYAAGGDMTKKVSFDTGWTGTSYLIHDPAWSGLYAGGTDFQGVVIPGLNPYWVVARWTASVDATPLTVAGTIKTGSTSVSDLDFYIRLNGTEVYALKMAKAVANTFPYAVTLPTVKKGDTIDLMFRAEGSNDNSNLKVEATFIAVKS